RVLPASERIGPLEALIRDNPNSTAAAIELLFALPKLDPGPARSNAALSIPRIIVQYWDEAPPPVDVRAVMRSWRDRNANFRYMLFNNRSAQEYLRSNYSSDVLRAYRRAVHPAQRSDLFRLALLHAEGGVYADADDRCIAPIEGLIGRAASFIVYREEYG